MKLNSQGFLRRIRCALMPALVGSLLCSWQGQAATTIVSTVPADGATGVSTTTTVVFTFSGPMNPGASGAFFYDPGFNFTSTTLSWSTGNTVLTCTPVTPFPASTLMTWAVSGQDVNGDPVGGSGTFTTGTGSSGGSGTNAITTFSVGKVHHYNQTSSGSPVLDPATPYGFAGAVALSSNRTATSVTLTLPTGSVSNLIQLPPPQSEIFLLSVTSANQSTYDATFPSGNYTFFVQAPSSNQTVMVSLPDTTTMPQPGAPHLTNYAAAQTVDATQPFVLGWDAFPGGTAADYIDVDIGSYGSPAPGLPGALTGTARIFTIPAGTLQPNTTYPSRVGFFRFVGSTNSSYATAAFRATYTEFSLVTSASGSLVLTNAAFAPSAFSFDVLCSAGQTVTVQYTTNLATLAWQTLLTTNSPGTRFHAIAPQAETNRFLFFRAKNGS